MKFMFLIFYSFISKMIHIVFTLRVMFVLTLLWHLIKVQVSKYYYFYSAILFNVEFKYVKYIFIQINFYRKRSQEKLMRGKTIFPSIIINIWIYF